MAYIPDVNLGAFFLVSWNYQMGLCGQSRNASHKHRYFSQSMGKMAKCGWDA